MLKAIVDATQLDPQFCAELVRVSQEQFMDWMSEKAPVPGFLLPELSSILGVPANSINDSATLAKEPPAIWFKLRDTKLTEDDRQFVGVIRKFGYYFNQLQRLTGRSTKYEYIFAQVRASVDSTANPAVQGRAAAKAFREATGLDKGQRGIGDIIRGHLRSIGLLLIESPLPKSDIEGCCFRAGPANETAPCVFANTYKSSWFRRNYVLAHEICHAIFDLNNEQLSVDYKSDYSGGGASDSTTNINEIRAQFFADECVIPRTVLVAVANQIGLHWDRLRPEDLGFLIAKCEVEQRLLLRAALRYGLINQDQCAQYENVDCSDWIKKNTNHALTTREYLKSIGTEAPLWSAENRSVMVGSRRLRLPVGYVQQVLLVLSEKKITESKAAEMLMIDRSVFRERFGGQQAAMQQ